MDPEDYDGSHSLSVWEQQQRVYVLCGGLVLDFFVVRVPSHSSKWKSVCECVFCIEPTKAHNILQIARFKSCWESIFLCVCVLFVWLVLLLCFYFCVYLLLFPWIGSILMRILCILNALCSTLHVRTQTLAYFHSLSLSLSFASFRTLSLSLDAYRFGGMFK